MVADNVIAAQLKTSVVQAFRILDESVVLVRQNGTAEEYALYSGAAGGICFEICEMLLDPLYRQHPELKPDNWP